MQFYVITPVGSDAQFAEKKSIVEKLGRINGLRPYFPFDIAGKTNFDINSTLTQLSKSGFVLADLSKERPSCYFEVGLAQAIGKDVYIIAERGTDIHQAHGRNLARFYHDILSYEQVISNVLSEAKQVKPVVRLRA